MIQQSNELSADEPWHRAMTNRIGTTLLALFLCLVQSACHSQSPPLVPVRGTVSYRGDVLRHGTIVFTPDTSRGTHGPLAMGNIEPDGSFSLATDNAPGAIAGWHRISVIALAEPHGDAQSRYRIPTSLAPERYRHPDLSGLVEEVKADRENVFQLDLQ